MNPGSEPEQDRVSRRTQAFCLVQGRTARRCGTYQFRHDYLSPLSTIRYASKWQFLLKKICPTRFY